MKKLLVSIVLVATAMTLNAQSAFKVGLGGAFNSTWLINQNVSDADDELDVAISWGGNFGLNLQYYFNENVGLSLGVMRSGHNQRYTSEVGDETFESKVKLRYIDVPLMLRLGGNEKGAYFEFGPQFSFLGKATEEYDDVPSIPGFDFDDEIDVEEGYKSVTVGFLLGFGVDIKAGDSFTISTGLRLGYLGNVTKEYGSPEELYESDADGIAAYSHFEDADPTKDFDYTPTHRIVGGIFLGVAYTIPMK